MEYLSYKKYLSLVGKLVVISFHSNEDKIVKFYFKNFSKNQSRSNKYFPENKKKQCFIYLKVIKIKLSGHLQRKLKNNPRSRSAKLRMAVRSGVFREPKKFRTKFKKFD